MFYIVRVNKSDGCPSSEYENNVFGPYTEEDARSLKYEWTLDREYDNATYEYKIVRVVNY